MSSDRIDDYRFFLKDTIRKQIDFGTTDQERGVPTPPVQEPCPEGAPRIALPGPDELAELGGLDLYTAIARRQSRRKFADRELSLAELAFLLWATQGVRRQAGPGTLLRTVPSAGARHAFETYLYVRKVDGLVEGLYRYLSVEHELALLREEPGMGKRVTAACFGQTFAGEAAATLFWTAIPYRMEWRYAAAAHKVIAIDAGHVCQNLYLACESIGAGTCAIGAYDQEAVDELIGVDGEDEFTIYIAPVGKQP